MDGSSIQSAAAASMIIWAMHIAEDAGDLLYAKMTTFEADIAAAMQSLIQRSRSDRMRPLYQKLITNSILDDLMLFSVKLGFIFVFVFFTPNSHGLAQKI
ncbi:MAG: hypothetical protein WKG07_36205 [Hymenobacter sp.]